MVKMPRPLFRLRNWLFETGTRVLSVINCVMLAGWMFAILHDYKPYIVPTFNPGRHIPTVAVLSVLATALVGTLLLLNKNTARAKVISGGLMIEISLIWALLSAHVWHDYPPLTPQMTIYPCLSFLSWIGGIMIFEEGKKSKHEYIKR